ncbi:type II toxin-antitoxin system death-on-curing family toxin [Methanospirillum sp.]
MFTIQKLIQIQSSIILASDLDEDRNTEGAVRDTATLHYIVEKEESLLDSIEKAAWLLFSIASYHPFFQGNKRTALVASEMVLQISPKPAFISADEVAIALFVIEISKYDTPFEDVKNWILNNIEYT